MQIKSGPNNWLQYTRTYAPGANGWDTLRATLNQFVQPPDVGLFDPNQVQGIAINIRMLDTGAIYLGYFDNIYFDAPDQPITTGTTYATYSSANDSFRIQSIGLDASGHVLISWPGTATLQSAPAVTGPWTNVAGATSPYSAMPAGARGFYRLHR
jgi:hypothetical protein